MHMSSIPNISTPIFVSSDIFSADWPSYRHRRHLGLLHESLVPTVHGAHVRLQLECPIAVLRRVSCILIRPA